MRSRSRAAIAASVFLALSIALALKVAPLYAQGMALPGSFGVNSAGAATYSIPIAVVPGTAGMVPSLTLEYSSQQGNGFVGVGWSLGGLPAVGRCPKTIVQDGSVGNVNFDANDRFCLDGQRLVAVSGTYGADGTEYRTEIDGFSKIISRGTAGTGPAWFEVRTKSGQIMEFGHSTDSQILVQGAATVRVWAVSKVSDTKGNYLTVTYTNDATNGQAYPLQIDYTGNTGASLSPYNSVRFTYETRPDISPMYHAGVLIKTTQRLTNVKTYAGANVVSDYRLTYQQSTATARSRVTSVQLCDGSSNCLPATSFAWQEGGTFGFTKLNPVAGNDYPITSQNVNGGSALQILDWDGDGRNDAVWYYSNDGRNRWFLNNGISSGVLGFTTSINPIPQADLNLNGAIMHFADLNGDGIPDMVYYRNSDGTNRWYMNTGVVSGVPTFSSSVAIIPTAELNDSGVFRFGDFNGDGLTDILWHKPTNGKNRWYINTGVVNGMPTFSGSLNVIPVTEIEYDSGVFYLGDFNGDGMTDALYYKPADGMNRWYISNGVVNGAPTFTTALNPIPTTDLNANNGVFYLGDFNGDGLSDLLWYRPSNGTNRFYINKGVVGGVPTFEVYANPVNPNDISGNGGVFNVGDWNSDGLLDIAWRKGDGTNRWFINKGVSGGTLSFTVYLNTITPSEISDGPASPFVGDWGGDGVDDYLYYNKQNGMNKWFNNNTQKPDLLTSITTGLGATTTITFKPLTDSSVYTKDTGGNAAVFPVLDLQAAAYAVRQVDFSNGIGGTVSTQYAYVGAKTHVQGRGFLGFRQMVATDVQTNIVETTTYRQDFPYTGLVASQTRKLGAQTLSETSNTYELTNAGGGSSLSTPSGTSAPYRVSLTQAQVSRWDLNGATLPTVTSTYQYDAYGNATQVVVAAADEFSKTTNNTYTNDTTNWLLGRLTGVTVTSTKP